MGGDTPERPESVLGETVIGAPEIVASQVDVLPAERGEVGEQFIWHHVATVANNVDGTTEIDPGTHPLPASRPPRLVESVSAASQDSGQNQIG